MDWARIVAEIIVPLALALISAYLVPAIRDKRIKDYVATAVAAAEQVFPAGTGDDKYAYVRTLVVQRFKISDDVAKVLIEAAVFALNDAKKKTDV